MLLNPTKANYMQKQRQSYGLPLEYIKPQQKQNNTYDHDPINEAFMVSIMGTALYYGLMKASDGKMPLPAFISFGISCGIYNEIINPVSQQSVYMTSSSIAADKTTLQKLSRGIITGSVAEIGMRYNMMPIEDINKISLSDISQIGGIGIVSSLVSSKARQILNF